MSSSTASESVSPAKKEAKSRDSDKYSDKSRRKDRNHENRESTNSRKRHSSRDAHEKSKRRHRDRDDDDRRKGSKSKHDRHHRDSKSDRNKEKKSYHSKDKYDRKYDDERKYKERERRRSKTPENKRRRSSSSSPERGKQLQSKSSNSSQSTLKPLPNILSSSPVAASPQKSPMISMASATATIAQLIQNPLKEEPKIELPSYYNPNVINVTKFAEQQKKRKMLWSGKKDEPTEATKWASSVKFAQDSDGTKASKFMRLMGIKDAPKPEASAVQPPVSEMFSTMEQQYEVARQATHISRGVGLGFSGSRPF